MALEDSLSITEIITHLQNHDEPLKHTILAELSNLSRQELGELKKSWQTLSIRRRKELMERLVELGENNFEFNFDIIFRDLLNDQDPEIRQRAIQGLWESEDASLILPLIRLMGNDDSPKVRTAAIAALGKFSLLAEHGKIHNEYTDRLLALLLSKVNDKKDSIAMRMRALEAVAPFSSPLVVQAIGQAYHSKSRKIRLSAIYAMGKNCSERWLPSLIKELRNEDAEFRYEAVVALAEMETQSVAGEIARLVADPDFEVQQAAIRTLGQIGGSTAKQALVDCLKSSSEAVRHSAEQSLAELSIYDSPMKIENLN